MSNEVKLPRLGQGMEAGTIVKWLKSEGDRVEKGEPLFEVDTDKATQEVEAEASGVLLKIAVESGEVPVGETIAVIGEEGEAVEAPAKDEAAPEPEEAPAPDTASADMSGARHRDGSGTAGCGGGRPADAGSEVPGQPAGGHRRGGRAGTSA